MSKMTSGSQMKAYCAKLGLYLYLKKTMYSPHQAAFDEMQGGELNFQVGHEDNIISILDAIINFDVPNEEVHEDAVPTLVDGEVTLVVQEIDVKAALLELKKWCLAYANPVEVAPEPAITETLLLPAGNSRHTVTIEITTNPSKTISIPILHRYGNDLDNLTEWHECGTISNVRFKQDIYSAVITSSKHIVRELKLVSPEVVGMSIYVPIVIDGEVV